MSCWSVCLHKSNPNHIPATSSKGGWRSPTRGAPSPHPKKNTLAWPSAARATNSKGGGNKGGTRSGPVLGRISFSPATHESNSCAPAIGFQDGSSLGDGFRMASKAQELNELEAISHGDGLLAHSARPAAATQGRPAKASPTRPERPPSRRATSARRRVAPPARAWL